MHSVQVRVKGGSVCSRYWKRVSRPCKWAPYKPSGTLKQQAHQACQRARRSAKELRVDVGKSSTSTTPKALCDLDHLGFFLVRVEMRGRVGRVRS